MKGFRFYAELPKGMKSATVKRLREWAAAQQHMNVVALLLGKEHRTHDGKQEALASVFDHANSDTAIVCVDHTHLRKCRRIPESLARQLHPRLFARLDAVE